MTINEYSNSEVNHKIKSLIDLVELYSNTNSGLMEKNRKSLSKQQKQLNIILIQISGVLDQMQIKIIDK